MKTFRFSNLVNRSIHILGIPVFLSACAMDAKRTANAVEAVECKLERHAPQPETKIPPDLLLTIVNKGNEKIKLSTHKGYLICDVVFRYEDEFVLLRHTNIWEYMLHGFIIPEKVWIMPGEKVSYVLKISEEYRTSKELGERVRETVPGSGEKERSWREMLKQSQRFEAYCISFDGNYVSNVLVVKQWP